MKETPSQDYTNRINKVFQYIDENLNEELSLERVSAIAHFSPFHFHRVFKFISNETLNAYITRRRLEKAAAALIHKREISIAEIASRNGFTDNSSFTRAFKKFYGLSPTAFREQNVRKFSKIGQVESKNGQSFQDFEQYICVIDNLRTWLKMNAQIEIKELPEFQVAYISSIGQQNLEAAFSRLMQWAKPKGLLEVDGVKFLTIYHDSFKITAPEKVRMSAGIIVKTRIEAKGEVSLSSIEKGRFITARLLITMDEFEKAWTSLFVWMNDNGYKKADRNPFEIYHNDFREHPEKKFNVELCIPVA